MKMQKLTGLLMVAGLLSIATISVHAADSEHSFKAHNSTTVAIKKMLVSEDGKTWGGFDIGAGIAAGGSETLVWDASTDNESCTQWVKAVFADGSENEPVKFNFCEAGLELEF